VNWMPVNLKGRACRRYRHLADEILDRDLTPREKSFFDAHEASCSACTEYERQGAFALNMLRSMDFDAPDSSRLTDRIVRKARLQHIRGGVKFWLPAFGGMAVGALMMMAILQLVGPSGDVLRNQNKGADALKIDRTETVFPELSR